MLLTSIISGSNHTKGVSLSNYKWMTQTAAINLHSNEYEYSNKHSNESICVGSCNTLNDFSNKVCIPNKTEDLNLNVFNTITGITEWKTLKVHFKVLENYWQLKAL